MKKTLKDLIKETNSLEKAERIYNDNVSRETFKSPLYGSYKINIEWFNKPDGNKITLEEYNQIQKTINK